jgi:hypothetical protein
MIVIILLWTLLYPIPGFASQSLEATNEAEIITYETVPPELSMETVRTLRRSLYFSTITFSTLGYADVAPIRWARELATIESFLGALLMAYLVSVLSGGQSGNESVDSGLSLERSSPIGDSSSRIESESSQNTKLD